MKHSVIRIGKTITQNSKVMRIIYKVFLLRKYLKKTGYFKSIFENKPVSVQGDALPWYSYSAISFLDRKFAHPDLINNNFTAFEFGAGNSSIWWSKRVKKIVSVENDPDWVTIINGIKSDNMDIHYCELKYGGKYCRYIANFNQLFDIIIVDGRDRNNCIKHCISHLSKAGIIVLDNSERDQYKEGIQHLSEKGFRSIEFHGLGPINPYPWSTTVFYRDNNIIEL